MLIAGQSVETADAHYRHLEALNRQGLITYDEVLKGEVHLEQARITLSRSSNSVRLVRARLLERMGLPLESNLSFQDSVEGVPAPLVREHRLETALAARPELAALEARLAALRLLEESLSAEGKPMVKVFAGGSFARPGIDMFRNEWISYGRAGVGVDWNFWDWGRKNFRVAKVKAQWEETLAQRRSLEQGVALELESASLAEEESRDRRQLSRKALGAAREHFRIVSARFDQAQLTNTDYLDAKESAFASELQHSSAEIDLAAARWRLAYSCGLLSSEIESRWPKLEAEKIKENE
jgi:outer membrane protein TolC